MDKILNNFKEKCNIASDINEHLPTLKEYAEKCENIIEMGVRSIVSTWAFLAAKPKKITSIDVAHPSTFKSHDPNGCNLELVEKLAKDNGIEFNFVLGNTLEIEIKECDLLFIDTLHTYSQLKKELDLHAEKAKKYLILHDTESFKENGEDKVDKGIGFAIEEFLLENKKWEIEKVYTNNNGLMILKRCLN
jgi:hypothetical protein